MRNLVLSERSDKRLDRKIAYLAAEYRRLADIEGSIALPERSYTSWRPTIWWLLASRSWTGHDLDDLYLGLRSAPTLVPQISGDLTPGRSHQKLHSLVNSGIAS